MRVVKKIGWGLLVVFIIIQFIQPAHNKSDRVLPTDLIRTLNVSQDVQRILQSACYDCHSNNTNYPWYARVQPLGWLLERHIRQGKAELNFSDFGSYSLRRQFSKLSGIVNSVKDGTMPVSTYTLIHKARLSKEDKALIIEWATRIKDSLGLNN